MKRPKVICLCGSTRFADIHAIKRWELELRGHIVLMINYLPGWYGAEQGWSGLDHFGEQAGFTEQLDELHLRKIDLADSIFIINIKGYIGESTRREIEYAKKTGKPIEYLEPEDPEEQYFEEGVALEEKTMEEEKMNSIGVEMIQKERQRQVEEEDFCLDHDDEYIRSLTIAGALIATEIDRLKQ